MNGAVSIFNTLEPTLRKRTCSICSRWWPDSTGTVQADVVVAMCTARKDFYPPGGHTCQEWKSDRAL